METWPPPPPAPSHEPPFWPRPRTFRDLLLEATPRLYVTPTLIVLNVGWFAIMVALGVSATNPDVLDLQRYGANFGPLTLGGEWWRLLSAAFVHVGLLHLFLNMWALWSIGVLTERLFGNVTYLLIYVTSGLGCSVASLAWHPHVTSAGASGAVFGIAGALVAFVYLGHITLPPQLQRVLKRVLPILLGLNLLLGFVVPGLDNAGHIGGLVVGLILGAALHRPIPVKPRSPVRFLAVPAVLLGLVATAALAVERSENDPELLVADALRRYTRGELDPAIERLERAVELDPELVPAFVQLGAIALEAGETDTGFTALERAVALSPDSARIRSEVGLLYLVNDRVEDAVENLRAAAKLEPDFAEHHNRLALALAVEGAGEESLAEIERALELSPGAPHLVDSLGTVRFYRGDLDDAVAAYREAVDREPRSGAYRFNLSVALYARGDVEEAAEELAEARRLEPGLEGESPDEPLL